MTVLSFIQSKGGVGKSTLLCSLAYTLHADPNNKVVIMDTDKQGTSSKFADKVGIPFLTEHDSPKIRPTIKELKEQGYTHIFVDTAGFASDLIVFVVMSSDCVIVPTSPSEPDAQGLFKTLEHVQASIVNDTAVVSVMNNANSTMNISKSVTKALKNNNAPLLDCTIGSYSGFKELHSTGTLKGNAQRDINRLIGALQIENIL